MIKLYIGGSPCTHWSIAQTKNRETEPSGLGWELFENYVIGLKKYKPDYFLYENNKSMSPAIKAQITKELGVEPILINSSLVSAQNRQRLYWTNIPGITQPEDRGILLRDILETGIPWQEKAYTLTTRCHAAQAEHTIRKHIHTMVAEPATVINISPSGKGMNGSVMQINGKTRTLTTNKGEGPKTIEPVRIGTFPNGEGELLNVQSKRIYDINAKAVPICAGAGGMGAKTGLYAVPCCTAQRGRYTGENGEVEQHFEVRQDGKTNTLTTVQKDNMVVEPINDQDGKARTIKSQYAKTSIANLAYSASYGATMVVENWNGKTYPVYEVRNGLITIKEKQYPIKLQDGYYIIRKLTVLECMRLQTVPEWYIFPVSDSQAYKMLGNGWTVDVIAHQLSFIPGILTEEIEVMSMYDGMSCGHIALDVLGANVIKYYATEIDKYAIQTAKHNYPTMEHIGDAYQVRNDDWFLTSQTGNTFDTYRCIGQITIDDWLRA